MTVHTFTVADAQIYGVEKATILQNLRFWLDKNNANKRHCHDGYVWTYNSAKAFHELFPYMSSQKIARHLRELESVGVIKSGNFNKAGYDQTKWYTIVQEYTLQCSNLNNGIFKSEQPIPDSKPDIKTDTYPAGLTSDLLASISNSWNELMTTQPTVDLTKQTQINKKRWAKIKKIIKDHPDYTDHEYWEGHISYLATLPELQWQRDNKQLTFDQAVQLEKFERNLGLMKMGAGQ